MGTAVVRGPDVVQVWQHPCRGRVGGAGWEVGFFTFRVAIPGGLWAV